MRTPSTRSASVGSRMEGGERAALLALLFLVVVTALWWWLALWPAPQQPEWVQHARAICFGTAETGLPSAGGWILLIGEPVGMFSALALLGGRALRSAGARLWARSLARTGLAAFALLIGGGALATGLRVARRVGVAPDRGQAALASLQGHLASEPRLVDQHGQPVRLADLRGKPVLLTFAFAQCETVCPLLVHDARAVRSDTPRGRQPALLIITLDPWRDTPSRLPSIAERWGLRDGEHLLSGPVEAVLAAHAAWGASGPRNPRTGGVTHSPLTFVLDAEGRVRFRTAGRRAELREALNRL